MNTATDVAAITAAMLALEDEEENEDLEDDRKEVDK